MTSTKAEYKQIYVLSQSLSTKSDVVCPLATPLPRSFGIILLF